MKLSTSYKQILSISIPIMLGSAAQNIIVLTDNVFLYHKSALDFASIGLIGVFYLIIASLGYGFSRGGQIIIARRYGEHNIKAAGDSFKALLGLEMIVAIILFITLQCFSEPFFKLFIDSPEILEKSLEYIYPRSWGIFFSYTGVAFIALYTGIARTKFIMYDTLILAVVNLFLNYVLIFGKWGFPEMGIAGAAWASTIAEIVAFFVFIIYMRFDKEIWSFRLLQNIKPDFSLISQVFKISSPIVAQAVLGMGSWFVFFSLVENMGQRQLELSNLVRNVFLILSIPTWGYSAGINTIVSNFIGQNKRQAVIPMIWKTSKLNLFTTLVISIPIVLFPDTLLYPLFGGGDMSLISEAGNLFYVMLGILIVFSIGGIVFNGLAGTGATYKGLKIQFIAVIIYMIFIYCSINVFQWSLEISWLSEIIYWGFITIFSLMYLYDKKWYFLKV